MYGHPMRETLYTSACGFWRSKTRSSVMRTAGMCACMDVQWERQFTPAPAVSGKANRAGPAWERCKYITFFLHCEMAVNYSQANNTLKELERNIDSKLKQKWYECLYFGLLHELEFKWNTLNAAVSKDEHLIVILSSCVKLYALLLIHDCNRNSFPGIHARPCITVLFLYLMVSWATHCRPYFTVLLFHVCASLASRISLAIRTPALLSKLLCNWSANYFFPARNVVSGALFAGTMMAMSLYQTWYHICIIPCIIPGTAAESIIPDTAAESIIPGTAYHTLYHTWYCCSIIPDTVYHT